MIREFLKPFRKATLNTQGHKAILDSVLFTMDVLLQYFKLALVCSLSFFLPLKP